MTNSTEITPNHTESSCPKCGAPIPVDAPQGLCPKCVLGGAATESSTSHSKAATPAVEEVALQFPELEIVKLIGAGGMGAVYKARQPKLDRFVALKILSHDLASDPSFTERFNREARVLARLNHPNIVTVYDFGTQGPYCFLLMEFVDGVNLRQAMQTGGFAPTDTLALVQDICGALKFAHEEGILHRDIKPENVLIDSRGRVKIADFGIAKLIGGDERDDLTLTAQGAVLGSPHYMAPEQIETPGEVDQRADIYSLGVVFYELLTGELPLGRFAAPSKKSPLDPRIDEIVMRALEKERDARFHSAGEVKTRVEAITQPDSGRPASADTLASDSVSARFSTTSAVITGLSLLLGALSVFILIAADSFKPSDSSQERFHDSYVAMLAATAVVVVGIPALLGILFGGKALGEIRQSEGRKTGRGSALFGTLTWPALLSIALIAFVLHQGLGAVGVELSTPVVAAIALALGVPVGFHLFGTVGRWVGGERNAVARATGWMNAIKAAVIIVPIFVGIKVVTALLLPAGTTPDEGTDASKEAGFTWRKGRPEIELAVTVAAGLVATFELVSADATGEERVLNDFQGYILASSTDSWRGFIKIGSIEEPGSGRGRSMLTSIEGFEGAGGTSVTGTLVGPWVFGSNILSSLELSSPGNHVIEVATIQPDGDQTTPTDTLSLRVETKRSSLPGARSLMVRSTTVGLGDASGWAEHLSEMPEKEKGK